MTAERRANRLACVLVGLWLGWSPGWSLVAQTEPGSCGPALDQHLLRAWTSEDGLPLDTVYALGQDPDGFLWVGTEDGLARFDGVTFDRIGLADVLSEAPEFILSLAVHPDGHVFVGTAASGILRLSHASPHDPVVVHEMRHFVQDILLGDDGFLLAATRGQGLLRSVINEIETTRPTAYDAPSNINTIARRRAGGYWIGLAGDGLQSFDGNAVQRVPGTQTLAEEHITALLEDSQGLLWIGTRKGLFSFDGQALHAHGLADGLQEPVYALSLLEDSRGHLWVGLGGGGVARRCGDVFETLTPEQGAGPGRVNDLLEDREGSIWLATGGGGLIQMRVGAAVPLTSRHGLPDAPALPITQTSDGNMWIGTFGGGLARYDGARISIIDTSHGLANDRVLALAAGDDGALWAGTHGGLNLIRNGRVERSWTAADGLPHDTVISLLYEDGQLWIGTVDGLGSFDGQTMTTLAPEGGFRGYIIHLFRARDDTLWIGTDGGGLYHMRGGRIEVAPFADDLPNQMVSGMHETDQGILWVTTLGGLVRWDGKRATWIGQRHGLPDGQILSIVDDDLGNFWMSGNRGVFRVRQIDLEAVAIGASETVKTDHFTHANGMPRSETNGGIQPAVWRDHQGRLWYPTTEGVAIFNPHSISQNMPAPTPVLRRIASNAPIRGSAESLHLEPRPQWVEFNYSAPTFIRAASVEYQYRLTGFDRDWYTTVDQSAMYRRLPAGQYKFQLRARKAQSDWSEIIGIDMTVERYWLHNPWLWLVASLLILSLLLTILQRLQRRRETRRERLVQAQKLEAIGLMAGGIAHDFNNVLTRIMSGTEMLADEFPVGSQQKRLAESILESSESGAALTRQLLAFARRQPVELHWLDLSRQINDFRQFLLRMLPPDIDLDWQVDDHVGYCLADGIQLQQVIVNLVLNARDAMPEGGELRVSLTLADRDCACLMVADTGIGMDSATREHIFDPFFTTKEFGKGTGLGLAVIYGIIKQLHGSIEVESEPNGGARFRIMLPVRPKPPAS